MDGPGRLGGEPRQPRLLRLRRIRDNVFEAELVAENGEKIRVQARLEDDILETPFGRYHLPSIRQLSRGSLRSSGGTGDTWLVDFDERSGELRAKLSMKVVEVLKEPGARVDKGEKIAVIETMKMLNEIHSPCSGELVEASRPGSGISPGQVIARIKCRPGND